MRQITTVLFLAVVSLTAACRVLTKDANPLHAGIDETKLPELMDRLARGKLSDAKAHEITRMALAVQGDTTQPWTGAWGDWIIFAREKGAVSDHEYWQYAKQSASKWVFHAHRSLDDHTGIFGLSFDLKHEGGRTAAKITPNGLEISYKILELTVDGIPLVKPDGYAGKWSLTAQAKDGPGWFRVPQEVPGMEALKSGKRTARLVLDEEIYESCKPDRVLACRRIELIDEFDYYRDLYFANPPTAQMVPATSSGTVR